MEATPRAHAAQATEEEGRDEGGARLAAQAEAHAADVAEGADGDRALPRGRVYQLLALRLALESTKGAALEAYALPEGVTAAAAAALYADGAFEEYVVEGDPTAARRHGGAGGAEGHLVRAVRDTRLKPLMEVDVLASLGMAVSTRTAEDEGCAADAQISSHCYIPSIF